MAPVTDILRFRIYGSKIKYLHVVFCLKLLSIVCGVIIRVQNDYKWLSYDLVVTYLFVVNHITNG